MIENFYGKDLGIELPLQSLYVCTSESQLSHTVMFEFTCEESEVCNGTDFAALFCFPGYGWNIRSVEMLDVFDGTLPEYDDCTYCINDSMRIELFPSYPSNSYQCSPSSHRQEVLKVRYLWTTKEPRWAWSNINPFVRAMLPTQNAAQQGIYGAQLRYCIINLQQIMLTKTFKFA